MSLLYEIDRDPDHPRRKNKKLDRSRRRNQILDKRFVASHRAPHETIVWFRQDLRVHDNPALASAASRGSVLPLYILDDVTPGHWRMGAASRWWLLPEGE
jgi:hypothetical protein